MQVLKKEDFSATYITPPGAENTPLRRNHIDPERYVFYVSISIRKKSDEDSKGRQGRLISLIWTLLLLKVLKLTLLSVLNK